MLFGGKAGKAGFDCGNAATSFSRRSWNSEYLPSISDLKCSAAIILPLSDDHWSSLYYHQQQTLPALHNDRTYVECLDFAGPYYIGPNAREIAANNYIVFDRDALSP